MMSDMNLVSALGPSAGPPPQRGCRAGDPGPGAAASAAPSDAASSDGTFAALVDNAAAAGGNEASDIDLDEDAQIDPHAVDTTNPDADGVQGAVTDPLVFPEWWLLGSATACQSSSDAARSEAAIDADENADDEDAESNEVPVEGILNINWLLAQPVSRLPRNLSTESGGENTQTDAPAVGAGSLKGVSQPFARTWNMVASLEANAPAAASSQAESKTDAASVAQPDLVATVEALVGNATPEVSAEAAQAQPAKGPAGQAAPARSRSAAAKVEFDARTAEMIAAQQRAGAAAIQGDASTAPPMDPSPAEVARTSGAPTAWLEQTAAARLARFIERSGGVTIEAAGSAATVQPLDTSAGTTQDGSSAFAFTSRNDQAPSAPEPVRVGGTSTPVFVVPQAVATTIAGMPALDSTSAAAPGAPPRDADMLRQFVQTMRVQFRDGIGDAVLRLRPEHLGEVSISLRVENGTVAATVNAEAAAVRQWLETNQASLRQSLSEQGLHLDRFVVQRDPEERQSREDQPTPRQRQPRRRNGNAETPRFEITV